MIRVCPVDQLVNSHAIWQVQCIGVYFQVPWAWDLGRCGTTGHPKEKYRLRKLSSQLHRFLIGDHQCTVDDQQEAWIPQSFDFAIKVFQIKSILF